MGKVRQGPLDVNLQMIKDGMAWHYRRYSKSAGLSGAEAEALTGVKIPKEKKQAGEADPNAPIVYPEKKEDDKKP